MLFLRLELEDVCTEIVPDTFLRMLLLVLWCFDLVLMRVLDLTNCFDFALSRVLGLSSLELVDRTDLKASDPFDAVSGSLATELHNGLANIITRGSGETALRSVTSL